MQTTISMPGLAVSLVCLTLCAQEPRRPASASTGISAADVESYFGRMDTSGDGKLSRGEVDGYPTLKNGFDSFDSNGDGGIALDEMQSVMAQWRQSQRQNPPTALPQTAAAAKRSFAGTGNATDRGERYLVLISIDGCRPDYLSFEDIPNIKTLISAGITYDEAWAGQLRNDTPPGHVSISTGVFPARHGVIGFHWQDPATGAQFKPTTWFGVGRGQLNELVARSGCGSLGSIYKQAYAGAKVAAFSSDKFYAAAALGADSADFVGYCRYDTGKGFGTAVGQTLSPETVTGRQVPVELMNRPELQQQVANPWDGDSWTVDFALQLVAKEKPEILLLNLALCDDIGHTHGANLGRQQMAGIIANADRQIGRLVEAYRQAGIYDKTIFVITSDHGMSANLRTIDESPMAPIVSEYGMKRSAARLEFYVKNPSKAKVTAEDVVSLKLPGIHAVYYKEQIGKSGFHYLPAPGTSIDPDLDACYRYLTSTFACPHSVDVVCFPAEGWNIPESVSFFRGDHGTVTWDNQHIPLIIAGPGIRKGATSQAPARLVDIAPTVLAAMGLAPENMDGVVLADALVSPADGPARAQQAVNERLTPLQDADGKVLPEPVEMLVAAVWDLGEIVRDSRVTGRDRRLTLAVRDESTGNWTLVPGAGVPASERGFACIRSLKVHTDKVTGREYLFVAAGCGGMYKSVYDPATPGRIRWLEGDELDKSYGRGQSMCEANGDLYVSYDYGGLLVQNQAGGVFRRMDGAEPKWERVYRNYDPNHATWNQTGRGITAVPAEDGSGQEVILVGIENPPEPIIVRIEPHHGHRAVTELNYNEYFTGVFGRKPQLLGGSAQYPHAGNEIPALNRFDPFVNPETGKLEHFVTLFLFHPDDPAEGCNNAYFLIRRAPGEYDWGEVTSDLPAGESLRGVRTIEKSPFPNEPQTYYFGGFFTGPDVQPPRPNLAWIFKGVVGKRERGAVKTASPVEVVTPALYEDAEHGFSFQYPGNMARTKPGVMTMANTREAPTVLVDAAAAQTVREAAVQAFRAALGAPKLIAYTECNLYLGSSTGVAGNLTPGGRVGRRFTCRYHAGNDRPALAAVGMGWTEGNHTTVIAVSYWGDYTEGLANVLLNKIIVSLKIERGVGQNQRAAGGATPTPRAGAGQFDALLKSLDTNGDGKITQEEAGGAPWFGRLDQNQDGVIDAAELEMLRKAKAAGGHRGGTD